MRPWFLRQLLFGLAPKQILQESPGKIQEIHKEKRVETMSEVQDSDWKERWLQSYVLYVSILGE